MGFVAEAQRRKNHHPDHALHVRDFRIFCSFRMGKLSSGDGKDNAAE